MNTKGFVSLGILLAIILGVVVVVVGGGAYYAMQSQTTSPSPQEQASNTPTPTCAGRDSMAPYILSITPTSGPVGSKVTIKGCNLSGFEGDVGVTFERSDGKKIGVAEGTLYRTVIDVAEEQTITGTITTACPMGSKVGLYSDLPTACETVEVTPGTYAVYTNTPARGGSKSNSVTFTVK